MNNYNQLKEVLNDIFELNKADLDFGIYRIINQKRKQVNEFIEKQLPEDIKQALRETQSSDKTELEKELKTLKKNLEDADVVAEDNNKYKALKERLQNLENADVLEQEVFSHLANFFRRYYKEGDFISMRRYKKDVYAIPYEGEEVKLHWANHDQYYIKSSENFKNYSFKTPDGKKITFQLKEVSTEQNNNKTQGDAERKFAIYKDQPVEEINGELYINFIYEPFSKTVKQESLLTEALEILTDNIPSSYTNVFSLSPTEKNAKRTLLEKHLNDYVAKNSFDYFIHKDLGGFLARELDFYIKNEVLYIDDINAKQTDFFVAQLSKVKAIKSVAEKVITFLAQIENFQKKLWLKKKFVIRTDYCITLDKIPTSYYPEILSNKAQLAEWKNLFDVDVQNNEQLVFEQFLVLDTKFFDESFKDRLLAEFDDLDNQTTGLLINSENYQALSILTEKHKHTIQGIYVDPPYNTSASEIIYKNSYKHSSWLSLIHERISNAREFLTDTGIFCLTIDDLEFSRVKLLMDFVFGEENHIATTPIRNNPSGRSTLKGFSVNHEYGIYYQKSDSLDGVGRLPHSDKQLSRYSLKDKNGYYEWENLRRNGPDSNRYDRPKQYYPILVNKLTLGIKVPKMTWDDSRKIWEMSEENQDSEYVVLYPIHPDGTEKVWRYSVDNLINEPERFEAKIVSDSIEIYRKKYANTEGILPRTWWEDAKYSARDNGTRALVDLFHDENSFDFPKAPGAVMDSLKVMKVDASFSVIDFFGGSGTTGHATIKLNREDGGNRKYILIEMGAYFNSVTKPRIQKVIYSDNWKNGKPLDKGGISQIVKYQVLESYEDTLNNLYIQNKTELDFTGKAKEEYLLHYMLEMESREHLFNLEMFRKPFDYQLKVTENNELKPTKVDLVETFNYLIGLYVSKVQRVKDIKVVEGTTRTGLKTLVIWRDLETTTHDEVEKLLRRFYDSQRTKEFQQIYINGDHHLENIRSEGDQFKIKMIEETFFKKMFNETEL